MKESVGYTVTLNIAIVFIVVVFAFIVSALIYFKSNKFSNVITSSIEKYEGYNNLAIKEINSKLNSLGYNGRTINCKKRTDCTLEPKSDGTKGYCVYFCNGKNDNEYYYKIRTNMPINIPIINNLLNIPVYSNTNTLYDFEKVLQGSDIK